jgi:hypothetical protein
MQSGKSFNSELFAPPCCLLLFHMLESVKVAEVRRFELVQSAARLPLACLLLATASPRQFAGSICPGDIPDR